MTIRRDLFTLTARKSREVEIGFLQSCIYFLNIKVSCKIFHTNCKRFMQLKLIKTLRKRYERDTDRLASSRIRLHCLPYLEALDWMIPELLFEGRGITFAFFFPVQLAWRREILLVCRVTLEREKNLVCEIALSPVIKFVGSAIQ